MDPNYGIIYSFDGARLSHQQAVDRLYRAGFHDVRELTVGFATMMGESGCYLKAWHNNCDLNDDGTVKLDADGKITIRSTDLGFIQRNVHHKEPVKLLPVKEDVAAFIAVLYQEHPELANAGESALIARQLYEAAGHSWKPWFAWVNGSYRRSLPTACRAVEQYLESVYLNAPWR